jgi:hypothetical protein
MAGITQASLISGVLLYRWRAGSVIGVPKNGASANTAGNGRSHLLRISAFVKDLRTARRIGTGNRLKEWPWMTKK